MRVNLNVLMEELNMSWRYDGFSLDGWGQQQTHNSELCQIAEDWLGPERSLEDLEVWEQRRLLAEIEADLMGPEPQLQIVNYRETHYDN